MLTGKHNRLKPPYQLFTKKSKFTLGKTGQTQRGIEIQYEQIALRFTEIYWNLVLKYHLRQEIKTKHHELTSVEKELFTFCDKYAFSYAEKNTIFPFD